MNVRSGEGLEPFLGYGDDVVSLRKQRDDVASLGVAYGSLGKARGLILGYNLSTGYHGAGSILGRAGDASHV